MNRVASHLRTICAVAALAGAIVLTTPVEAWAYIDPGTGSYMFQIAAAGLLGALYTVRRWWHVLMIALRGRHEGLDAAASREPRG